MLPVLPADLDLACFVQQSGRILQSYRHWFGHDLVERTGSAEQQARRLFFADQVVLSSGNEPDPLLNYGNQLALTLWEATWTELVGLPGRLTAEPMERSARAAFLQRVREHGFVTDYQGVRISRTGRRFWIGAASVWNIPDAGGRLIGQAATFRQWKHLPPG